MLKLILALICAHNEPRAPPVALVASSATAIQPARLASTAPDWTVYRGELATETKRRPDRSGRRTERGTT